MDLGVQVFRLWEESLPQMKKKQLLLGTIWAGLVVVMMAATGVWSGLGLPVALLALGVVVVTAALGSLKPEEPGRASPPDVWIVLVAFFVLMFHVFNRQQEPLQSIDRPSGAAPATGR